MGSERTWVPLGENSEPRPTLSENIYSSVTGGRGDSQDKGAQATSDGGEGRALELGREEGQEMGARGMGGGLDVLQEGEALGPLSSGF